MKMKTTKLEILSIQTPCFRSLNKKAKTIISVSILILLVVSLSGVFVLAQIEELSQVRGVETQNEKLINLSLLSVVNKSLNSNIYFNETTEQYFATIYPKPINMKNLSGQYEAYEDLTDLSFDGNDLILIWNNKKVKFVIYTKDKDNKKEKLKDKSINKKNELNFKTNIQKQKGSIYYNHTLVKDEQKQPKKIGYDILTENVDCNVKGYRLICDEQVIIFEQAVLEQNLSVDISSNNVEISGEDLSYIDPSITIDVENGTGGWGQIEYDDSSIYDFDDEDLTSIGGRDTPWLTRGWVIFDVDIINDDAKIDDVDLYLYNLDTDVVNCDDNDIDIKFYEVDEEEYDMTPDTQDEMSELWGNISEEGDDFYGTISNLNNDNDTKWISKDLSYDSNTELESLIDGNPTDEFIVGMKVEPDDEVTVDCNIDFEDTSGDPNLPYIIVTYTIPDTTAPTTIASATSPPGGSSYVFGEVANDTVQITLTGCRTGFFCGWDSGEPNNYGGNEDCLEMRTTGLWSDVPCSDNYYPMCEQYSGSDYQKGTSTVSYLSAKSYCEGLGTGWHLVMINNESENDYVEDNYANTSLWLGGADSIMDGTWMWDYTEDIFWEEFKSGYPMYCVDKSNTCSPLTSYSSKINISIGGTSYLRYYGKDRFNNTESIKSQVVIIDRDYIQNISLFVNGLDTWNYTNYFVTTKTSNDISQELNNALSGCNADAEGYCTIPIKIHSDSAGKVNISNVNIYFNITEYQWNITGFPELSTYKTRVKVTDGLLNSSWDQSDSDFRIGSPPQNDTHKFYHKDSAGNNVAWLGNSGNIVLKGECFASVNCNSITDGSFIIQDQAGDSVAFINSTGDLCLESGDCSDSYANCDTPGDGSFIIANSTDYVSFINSTGDLCLVGTLTQNGNP